ncbi:hypothetical protein BDF20DRAFT_795299, partial [Mycotypha africana]|uniref:uncharacterized protein n=1 Tax=Mycotypha africana TaxID=64632 RepID=UPI00230197AE
FIPFTYTIGVRYTHPYHGIRDILVRGRIPDWCRTLIITECMRNLPIKPGMVLSGLLPFAKDMQFHFTQLSRKTIPYIYPDMLVSYEKMTMDLCWPQSPFDTEKQSPPQQRQSPMCDIPDHTAAIITKMANEWVANQQTIF